MMKRYDGEYEEGNNDDDVVVDDDDGDEHLNDAPSPSSSLL